MEKLFSECCSTEVDAEAPLLKAAGQARVKLVRILIEGGANIEVTNRLGQGAIIVAILSESMADGGAARRQVVSYLVKHGAAVNVADKYGRTPLVYACRDQIDWHIVRLLLEHGADPLYRGAGSERSAFRYSRANDDHSLTSLILAAYQGTRCGSPAPPDSQVEGGEMTAGYKGWTTQERRIRFRRKSSSLQEASSTGQEDVDKENKKDIDGSSHQQQRPKDKDKKLRRRHTDDNMTERCTELFDKLERTTSLTEQAEALDNVLSTLMQRERSLWCRELRFPTVTSTNDSSTPPERRQGRSPEGRATPPGDSAWGSRPNSSRSTTTPTAGWHADSPIDVKSLPEQEGTRTPPTSSGVVRSREHVTTPTGELSDGNDRGQYHLRNRLLDDLSLRRPGQLPALNVNLAKPIPHIASLEQTTEQKPGSPQNLPEKP